MNQTEFDAKPAISPEEYGKVIRGLELRSISLLECDVKSDPETSKIAFAELGKIPVDTSENASFAVIDGTVNVTHSYLLQSRYKRKNILAVKANYLLTFASSEEFSPEFFEVFQQIALPMFTWPYFREFVASMTGRMDLPELQLGLKHQPHF